MMTFLTALAGIITGISGIFKQIAAWFPAQTTEQKVEQIQKNVNQEEQDFEKNGRPD